MSFRLFSLSLFLGACSYHQSGFLNHYLKGTMNNLFFIAIMAVIVIGIQFGMRYYRARRLGYWLKIGMEAYGRQCYIEALPAFRKCVHIAPEWVHTHALLGMSLAQTGHREEALREIQMVEALQPKQGETWALIALFYALCMPEEHDTLLDALDMLYTIDPKAAARLIEKPQFRNLEKSERYLELQRRISAQDAARA